MRIAFIAGSAAIAANATAQPLEEVVVRAATGSRIARQAESPSPLALYESEPLRDAGLRDLRDIVGVLAINAGSENNSDNLTQNYTVGTANMNLRGLGVASTLVLLNGRRQVLSAVQTDDGSSFVDLAGLVPMLAVERVEILKDGASAIYGSEAVAGVANFITRQGFDGAELQAEFRTRAGNGSQRDITLDGVVGGELGDTTYLVAASYLDRASLLLDEVDWLHPATSGFGNPGSFNVPSLGRTVADPGCQDYAGLPQELAGGGSLCRFDYGPQITAVPTEERIQAWGRVDRRMSETTRVWAEFGHARNDISREVSPSFPVLNTPLIPAYHPGNPYGEDVYFQGRPYGFGHPPEINHYQHATARFAFGAEGRFNGGTGWDLSLVHATNDALLNPRDVIAANFQTALSGFGGSACDTSPTAPAPAVAGRGGCLFFNPFSSNFDARPGDVLHNSTELRDFIIGDYFGDGESTLTALEANVTGELPGFGGAYAAGVQLRDQTLDFAYDSITRHDGFAFLIGNADFAAHDDVYAAYGEIWLPLSTSVEFTGALRYEDYGAGTGDTVDPKLSLLIRPSDALSLRGSFSTSFRAPSPFQTNGVQTNFSNILDFDGSRTFAGRRTVGDPNLQPETSQAFNVGISWRDGASLALDADLWRYTFEDVLRKENAQAIVNVDPFDSRIQRTSAGTISIINVAFINADRIETTGIDLAVRTMHRAGAGTIGAWAELTQLFAYDVTDAGREIDALGKLNRANVGAPNQRFRAAGGVSWTRGSLDVDVLFRHVGSYDDDAGGGIGSFTTLDLAVAWALGARSGRDLQTTLTLGAANVLDEDPPHVEIAGSYDPRSADPRGRRLFLSVRLEL